MVFVAKAVAGGVSALPRTSWLNFWTVSRRKGMIRKGRERKEKEGRRK